MKYFLLILFSYSLFFTSLSSTSKDELNNELRKELGLEVDKKAPEPGDVTPPLIEESNPVRDRYQEKPDESGGLFWILLKILIVFAILTGILYYVLRLLGKNRESRYPVKGIMRVLSSLPISNGKEILILDVGGTLLTVGVTDGSINVLKEIDNSELKEKILQARDKAEPTQDSFIEVFIKNFKDTETIKSILSGRKGNIEEEEVVEEIKNRQIERLEKIRQDRQNILKKEIDRSNPINYS